MTNDKRKKVKKIIGQRIRVGVGEDIHFEDDEDVEVLGEDTTLIVSPEEAVGREIIGKKVLVQVGSAFEPAFEEIDKRELDEDFKKELKARVSELEKQMMRELPKNKVKKLLAWFRDNASWLVPILLKILSKYGIEL